MKRMAWTACVLVVSSLGISGMLAGGCGGDDTAPPGTGGSGGSAGSGVAGAKAGSGGTAGGASGAGGGSGSAVTTDSGSDAPMACMPAKTAPTTVEKATCAAGIIGDSGGSCLSNCFCTACPKEAIACLGDPKCKAVLDCAAATGCSSLAECLKPEKCGGIIAEAGTSVIAANDFACCGNTCQAMCPAGDAGSDAKTDAPASDAPASDATTSDAPASDATTSDAPASDATTSDAPADAAAATDADNDGG